MWRGNCITTGLGMRKIVILLTAANSSISLKKTGYVSHDFYIVFWSSSVGRSNFKVLHSFLTSNKIAKILEGEADMIALTRKFCSCWHGCELLPLIYRNRSLQKDLCQITFLKFNLVWGEAFAVSSKKHWICNYNVRQKWLSQVSSLCLHVLTTERVSSAPVTLKALPLPSDSRRKCDLLYPGYSWLSRRFYIQITVVTEFFF